MKKTIKSALAAMFAATAMPMAAQQTVVVFEDDFESNSLAAWTVIDVNNDGRKWALNSSANYVGYNNTAAACMYGMPSNDWLITPALNLTAGRECTLKFKYGNAGYSPEVIKVALGREATAEAMATEIMPTTDVNNRFSDSPIEYSTTFTPEEDGTYYIGIHSSGYDQFYLIVDDFSVSTTIDSSTPAAPAISGVAGEQGALKADITITCPTTDVSGAPLAGELTKAVLKRGEDIIKTWESGEMAATLTYTDNEAVQGINVYSATVSTASGESPIATVQVKVGVDVPTAVIAQLSDNNVNGTPVLTAEWDAVGNTGANGGYVDPSLVKYNIYDVVEDYYSVTTQLKGSTQPGETSYNFGINPDEGEQRDLSYLYAIGAENVAGEGEIYYIGGLRIIGEPYMLPFDETISMGKTNGKLWWQQKSGEYTATWSIASSQSYDEEINSGAFSWTPTEPTDLYALNTGKISLEGATNPVLRFAVKSTPQTASQLTAVVYKQGGEEVEVAAVDFANETEEGWITAKADLSDFSDSRYIMVKFIFEGVKGTAIYLDDIHVADELSDNLTLKMEAPASTTKGSETIVSINIENNGSNEAEGYIVRLYADNEEVWSQEETETLASHNKKNYQATWTPSLFDSIETAELKAVVEYYSDLDDEDNEATATIEVKAANAPQPENLTVEGENGNYTLSWNIPSDLTQAVTDDFEGYKANTVDAGENTQDTEKGLWGEWTTYDKDQQWVGGVFNAKLPFEGYKYAYVLFNPVLYNSALLEAQPALTPHSGNQYLMAANNEVMFTAVPQNNWLISPELTGIEQEISFYARSFSEQYPESFTVLYSTTDTEEASFQEVEGAQQTAPAEWTEVKVTIPEGTKYFAICQNTTSDNARIFMLDDITYYTTAGEPVSYNVYLDGQQIGNVDAEDAEALLNYLCTDQLSEGTHTFAVAAVYADGQVSEPVSATVEVIVDTISSANVNSEDNANTRIYSIGGQQVGNNYRGIVVVNGKKTVKK